MSKTHQFEAAIDIGTNTILILVAEVEYTGSGPSGSDPAFFSGHVNRHVVRTVYDQIDFVRLGEGVHQNRKFSDAAMERARKSLTGLKSICDKYDVSKIYGIATSASRDSKNAAEFYKEIQKSLGISIEIIPGETEAKLSFLGGLLPQNKPEASAVLDIGGGSTEFVLWNVEEKKVFGQSLDMGCVRLKEMFLQNDPYTSSEIEALENHVRAELRKTLNATLSKELRSKEWIGIAGTPTTLAGILLGLEKFDAAKLDGFQLDLKTLSAKYQELIQQKNETRKQHPLVGEGRADIIVPGTAILKFAMEELGQTKITVSSRGLRHGVIYHPEALQQRP